MQQGFKYPQRADGVTAEMLAMPPDELQKASRYPLHIFEKREGLYRWIARLMADEIKENNKKNKPTRWVLPIGPKGQYPILASICNEERISWKNVWAFHMDEYLDWQGRPVSYDSPFSFRRYADDHPLQTPR